MAAGFQNRNVAAILKAIQEGTQGPSSVAYNFGNFIPVSFITPAGYQILKPIPYAYQLYDCSLQAIGGNAIGANISIVFTQYNSTSQNTFCTFTPAGLLANTLVRMGDSGTTISSQSISAGAVMTNIRITESGGGVAGATGLYLRMLYSIFK